jgi:hypothetical protein
MPRNCANRADEIERLCAVLRRIADPAEKFPGLQEIARAAPKE